MGEYDFIGFSKHLGPITSTLWINPKHETHMHEPRDGLEILNRRYPKQNNLEQPCSQGQVGSHL